jgi:hypothetical protein
MSTAGRVFAEYWVDCAACREAEPLATNDKVDTTRAAFGMGYARCKGLGWVCSRCFHSGRWKEVLERKKVKK